MRWWKGLGKIWQGFFLHAFMKSSLIKAGLMVLGRDVCCLRLL